LTTPSGGVAFSTQTTDLVLLEDLDEVSRTRRPAQGDLDALRAVAAWIRHFVVRPNGDLGRAGPVCPFVPTSLERRTLWLAPEHVGDGGARRVVELLSGYRRLFLGTAPTDGDDTTYKVIVVVFPDLPAARAPGVFGEALAQLAVPSYVEDGIVFGPFYDGQQATSIRNPDFRPFQSPVPFVFVRNGVVDDWRFFLDDDEWLGRWARRFGEAGARALAGELRRLPWRERHG
jgi:Domain of unknown function (DUF6875)